MTFNNRYQDKTFSLETDILNKKSYFYFWHPEYLEDSTWAEHIPFAFWLIETFKPTSLVELGVFKGMSYFVFCQAINNLNLPAVCYGNDTRQGDEHGSFYNNETIEKVNAHNEKYIKFSSMSRSSFDEANEYFLDESIDLFHIDGFHTYEALQNDFDKWCPKLKENVIVLFHDINVKERGLGVYKFWSEIIQDFQHFQFDFGWQKAFSLYICQLIYRYHNNFNTMTL